MLNLKNPIVIILVIGVVFVMYICHILTGGNFDKWLNNRGIDNDIQDAYKVKFNLVVSEKYIDSANHANETIKGLSLLTNKEEFIYGSPGVLGLIQSNFGW